MLIFKALLVTVCFVLATSSVLSHLHARATIKRRQKDGSPEDSVLSLESKSQLCDAAPSSIFGLYALADILGEY